jgi:hypothetical protein
MPRESGDHRGASSAALALRAPVVARMPVAFFAMVLGVAGLANDWRAAGQLWDLPSAPGSALAGLAVAIWVLVTLSYAAKWTWAREAALAEWRHPRSVLLRGARTDGDHGRRTRGRAFRRCGRTRALRVGRRGAGRICGLENGRAVDGIARPGVADAGALPAERRGRVRPGDRGWGARSCDGRCARLWCWAAVLAHARVGGAVSAPRTAAARDVAAAHSGIQAAPPSSAAWRTLA